MQTYDVCQLFALCFPGISRGQTDSQTEKELRDGEMEGVSQMGIHINNCVFE